LIDVRVSPRLSRLPDVWLQLVRFHGYERHAGAEPYLVAPLNARPLLHRLRVEYPAKV